MTPFSPSCKEALNRIFQCDIDKPGCCISGLIVSVVILSLERKISVRFPFGTMLIAQRDGLDKYLKISFFQNDYPLHGWAALSYESIDISIEDFESLFNQLDNSQDYYKALDTWSKSIKFVIGTLESSLALGIKFLINTSTLDTESKIKVLGNVLNDVNITEVHSS
jgi:hypothetical protein